MKKLTKKIKAFFHYLWNIIDKRIVVPITKLVVLITDKFDDSGKRVELWLSKSTTLLFISLFLAIVIFIAIDHQILLFTERSAEVINSLPLKAVYNEEAYVVEGLPETVDITLIGSKTDLYIARQSPIYDITVDLTGLKPGTHEVAIKYNQATNSIDYRLNPSVATVVISQKISVTKTLSVDLLNQDKLDATLAIQNVNINSGSIIVKGAEHQLNQVASVKALVDVNNIAKPAVGTFTLEDIPLKAYDVDGNIVDVETVPSKISAEIEIASPNKEVPIRVVPVNIDKLPFGQAINSLETSETKVKIYGPEDVIKDINYVDLNVDVADLKEDRQLKVELPKPSGVKAMSVTNVTVNIKLGQETQKEIDNIGIDPSNLGENLIVQGLGADDIKTTVILKGTKSVIDAVTSDSVYAYIDLSGYKEGTYEVDVLVEGNDPKVVYTAKTKKVKIKITKA